MHREDAMMEQLVSNQTGGGAWPPVNAHLLGGFRRVGGESAKVWVRANEKGTDAMFGWAYNDPAESHLHVLWFTCAGLFKVLLREEASPGKAAQDGWQATTEVNMLNGNEFGGIQIWKAKGGIYALSLNECRVLVGLMDPADAREGYRAKKAARREDGDDGDVSDPDETDDE